MGFFERQLDKYDSYKRRKAYCAEEAKSAKSDFAAKKLYKACMSNQKTVKKKKNKKKGIVLYNVGPVIMIAMAIAFVLKILNDLHSCGKI